MSTINPIPSPIGGALPELTPDLAGRTPGDHLSSPMSTVTISPLGRSLSTQSSQRMDRHAAINNSDLPDAVKALLKMIAELRAALAKKLQELREVQADTRLTPAQKKERMQQIQTVISGLSHSLAGATQDLVQMLRMETLTVDQEIQAGMLAME